MDSPEYVADYIENELISLSVIPAPIKLDYALSHNVPFWAKVSIKIEFKDNRIKIYGNWLDTYWMSLNNSTDPTTLLSKGNLRCFKVKGDSVKICNEDRYKKYNSIAQDLIDSLISFDDEDDNW